MEIVCGIYKITSPSKKIYIGQSVNIEKRFGYYRRKACFNQHRLFRSLIKHGVNKHKFEIIHQCKREELNELEKYYVDLFQTFNSKYGLNIRDGGGNSAMISEDTKRKMSIIAKAKIGSKNSFYGKKHTEEFKKKLSKLKTGTKYSDEVNKKKGLVGGKNNVARIVLHVETGIYYGCVREAAESINWRHRRLARFLRGERINRTSFIYA